jgi:hypothetical protein
MVLGTVEGELLPTLKNEMLQKKPATCVSRAISLLETWKKTLKYL